MTVRIKVLIFTIFFIGLPLSGLSQIIGNDRFNQWYFGENWILDFNQSPPVHSKSSSMNAFEGSASIADQNGDVLFYTNGETVWNSNDQVMANGNGLMGDDLAAMAAIIVPVIGNRDKYYIFTTDGPTTDPSNGPKGRFDGLHYSVVDMTLDNGNGAIVNSKKNISLVDSTTERIIALKGANDREYWVVTQLHATGIYHAYKIDCNGVSHTPVVSNTGLPLISLVAGVESYGFLKPSHDGTKVAGIVSDPAWSGLSQKVQLMDFNPNSGVMSNAQLISGFAQTYYGIEFSPNDSILYVSNFLGRQILRYEVEASNIQATETVVHSYSGITLDAGALQLAPDGKIYVRRLSLMDRINNPNSLSNPGFETEAIELINPPFVGSPGLPTFFDIWPQELTAPDTTICWGDTTNIGLDPLPNFNYSWKPVHSLSDASVAAPDAFPDTTTTYTVVASNAVCNDTATVTVEVLGDSLYIQTSTGSMEWCPSEGLKLWVSSGTVVQWIINGEASPAKTSDTLEVDTTGVYEVAVENPCGDMDTVSATITVDPPSVFYNPSDTVSICRGDNEILVAGGGEVVRWRRNGELINGATDQYIWVGDTGRYEAVIKDTCDLLDSSIAVVRFHPQPNIQLSVPDSIVLCPNGDTTISAVGGELVKWIRDGQELTNSDTFLHVYQAATYSAIMKNSFGCLDTASTVVTILSPSSQLIAQKDTAICLNDSLQLNAIPDGRYQWLPASTTACDTCKATQLAISEPTTTKLEFTAPAGCTFTDSITIDTLHVPNVSAGNDTVICPGELVELGATGAATYTWSPSAGLDCANCDSTLANPSANTQYTVTGSNANGCSSIDSQQLKLHPKPNLSIAAPDTICQGSAITLSASGASQYSWVSNPVLSCLTCPSPTASLSATDTFTVVGTNTFGCTDTLQKEVFLIGSESFSIADDTTICPGDTLQLQAPANLQVSNIEWEPDSVISCANCPTTNVFPVASNEVVFSAISKAGCLIRDTTTIDVFTLNGIEASPDTSLCEGSDLKLQATGANSYTWYATNSLSCTDCFNPTLTASTSETITVTGQHSNGCQSSNSIDINVKPLPAISFSGPNRICPGDSAVIDISGVDSVKWLTTDRINCQSCLSATVFPAQSKYYKVKGWLNGCATIDSIWISVDPPSYIGLSGDSSVCVNSQGSFSVTGATNVTWGPPSMVSCTNCSTTTFKGDTPFQLTTSFDAANGCTYYDTITIEVDPVPAVTITPATDTICQQDTIVLSASASMNVSYQWNKMGLSNCDTCEQLPLALGQSDKVVVEAITQKGCIARDTAFVEVQESPENFLANDTSVCRNETLLLHLPSSLSGSWYGSNGLSCNHCDTTYATLEYPSTIYAAVMNTNGCEGIDSIQIDLHTANSITTSPDTAICPGDTIQITAEGGSQYRWHPSASVTNDTSSQPLAYPMTTTRYTVSVHDSNDCTMEDSVLVETLPAPVADAGKDRTIFRGTTVELKGSGGDKFRWEPADEVTNAFSATTMAYPDGDNNLYILEVENSNGCIDHDSVVITVLDKIKLNIPNAFSPNGDGRNDRFYLPNLQLYDLIDISIYNRWGERVYYSQNNTGWDGTYNGEPQPAGVYVYKVNLLNPQGERITKQGNITLLR